MIDAYCTAAEADVYLAAYAEWIALATAVKEDHLSWGRVQLDSTYSCPYDETDATDALKHANALTGYMNFLGTLFADTTKVTSSSVAAGTVSSTKTYKSGNEVSDQDPLFNQVKALLVDTCTRTNQGNTVALTRN